MSILFWIVGMGFGCSFSLVDVDCIEWVKTPVVFKLIRLIPAVIIFLGTFYLFDYTDNSDQ